MTPPPQATTHSRPTNVDAHLRSPTGLVHASVSSVLTKDGRQGPHQQPPGRPGKAAGAASAATSGHHPQIQHVICRRASGRTGDIGFVKHAQSCRKNHPAAVWWTAGSRRWRAGGVAALVRRRARTRRASVPDRLRARSLYKSRGPKPAAIVNGGVRV